MQRSHWSSALKLRRYAQVKLSNSNTNSNTNPNTNTNRYAQVKFTAINYGIVHKTEERRPAMIVVFFNAVLFFSGFPLINYLPRFFCGGPTVKSPAGETSPRSLPISATSPRRGSY